VEGTFKVLSDPGEDIQQDREAPVGPSSLAARVEEGGTVTDTPSEILATEHKEVAGALGASEPAESEAMYE
jgi:hypothetical protein